MHKRIGTKLCCFAALAAVLLHSGCAPVTVSSWPGDAEVYEKESGRLLGSTPLNVNLMAKDKDVILRKPGYFSKTITLSPIGAQERRVALEYRNQVVLVSTPPGAEIFLEDESASIGRTPFLVDYSNGYRTVELRLPGYLQQQVTIPEDPEGNVEVKLLRQPTVTVLSKPAHVNVYNAKGHKLGVTPLDVLALDVCTIELRKEGYYSKSVEVGPQTANPFSIELKREPTVIIVSEPEGATVVHRGVRLGKTPFKQYVRKEMELELSYDRHYSKTVTIAPDSPRQITVGLERRPYIAINSEPRGAKLYRAGGVELIGETPMELLVEENTALELHKPGYDVKSFSLSSNSARQVSVPLMRSVHAFEKTVLIDSEPSGALVYRPGGAELIGQTPLRQKVRNERNFELHKDGFRTKIVTVAPDSASNVVFALARDESARNATISDPLLNTPSSF